MIYAKKINRKQKAWLAKYERATSFEPMYQAELDSGELTFDEVAKKNIAWFEDWCSETLAFISTQVPFKE